MENYLGRTYPNLTIGQPQIIHNPHHGTVHGAYEVIQTTLNVNQKRAIGDFILFVAKRAMAFLIHEISARIHEPFHSALMVSSYGASIGAAIHQINVKYFSFREVLDPLAIGDPNRLCENLSELSRYVMEYDYNTQSRSLALLQDFVSLIRLVETSCHLSLSRESQDILVFISFLAHERNVDKISMFIDNSQGIYTSLSEYSPWSRESPCANPSVRASQDKKEWEEVYQIINLCIHFPLHNVIIMALRDISKNYNPSRQNRSHQYFIEDRLSQFRQLEEQSSKEFFNTICFHSIFIDFWIAFLRNHSSEWKSAINQLIHENPYDNELTEYFTEFLAFYNQ
jgi:hypothetical protein